MSDCPNILHYCFTNHSVIMAKNTSLFGKVSGKIGAVVFSTSGGETISREYNPHVANPNTQAQVNQRARMKLMSQLSGAMASIIAMPKTGLVSARNKFVKRNFASSNASNGIAQVSYENLQLTEGSAPLNQVVGAIVNNQLYIGLSGVVPADISRVIYIVFKKNESGQLQLVSSNIQETDVTIGLGTGDTAHFAINSTDFQIGIDRDASGATADYVIYAYGMKDTSAKATAQYGNYNCVDAQDIARLVATRSLSTTDYTFTETRGGTWVRGTTEITSTPDGSVRVYVTALGNGGTVTGGGTYELGAQVTIQATPASGYTFSRWVKNGTNQVFSTQNPYTFTANEMVDVVAVFDADGGGGL